MPSALFAPLDYVVLLIPLALVLGVTFALRRYMRSVSDFLAASRTAGRYVICTSISESGAGVMGLVLALEVYSRTGVSMGFWGVFNNIVLFGFTLFGLITFRFRETRCLTFHQFLEVRYDRRLRVFASFLNIFSGMINFGLVPAVGARFFVYLCGLPETVRLGTVEAPTFVLLMAAFMALSLLMTLSGGQISVMVTDCLEGLISGVLYLVVAFAILSAVTFAQMRDVLLSGKPGDSYINPFDIGARPDFNVGYVVLVFLFNIGIFRGSAWTQGFNAAAKTAHEAKMAAILGSWRNVGAGAMGALISVGAFTLLHHPDFAAQREAVAEGLKRIANPQLHTQMTMPMALGVLLAPGVKGAFCAIGLFGLLASQGLQLHNYGSTLLQDVVLPLKKKPFTPKGHLLALQATMGGIALFVCLFSWLYKPVDYLTMLVTLIGAIYLGGIGAVVWGGLYWKKGTAAGAWASMISGSVIAVACNVLQQFWDSLQPLLLAHAGHGTAAAYLAAHAGKFPLNGIESSVLAVGTAFALYAVVSLLTCRKDFDMDRMLHRGAHALPQEAAAEAPGAGAGAPPKRGFSLARLLGIDEHFTRGDRALSIATASWVFFWNAVALGILVWSLAVGKLSDGWWFEYWLLTGVKIPLVLGVVTTVW
ncbi:MAG TPA: hypothetical protein VIM58_04520, partial [Candidatus Methylacidiphilales bacterium]